MNLQMFSVYDIKARAFLRPFCMPNSDMAIRALKDSSHEPDHAFAKNPEDYTLYLVGEFSEDAGTVTSCLPEVVATVSQCIERKPIEEVVPERLHA